VIPSSGVSAPAQLAPAACSVVAVLLWGAADFSGGLGSRRMNAFVLAAFSHFCACILMFAIAAASQTPLPSRASMVWAIVAGSVGGFSLAIFYGALASGQMGLVAPVAALVGAAIPTLADIAMEGTPSRWTIAGFFLAIVAIWLITRSEDSSGDESGSGESAGGESAGGESAGERLVIGESSDRPKGVGMAALAGVGFSVFYLCIHQATGSPAWVAAISRVGSFAATSVAVVVTRVPLSLRGTGAWLGAFAGCLDIIATAFFIFASQHGRLDQAVVITSLYPATTVVLARIVLKEHLSGWRFVGLLAALAAVPLISVG
jgi:drug/metabolite transporter (DMT)-like permease